MNLYSKTLVLTAALMALGSPCVLAGQFPQLPAAQSVSDDVLSHIRGKYIAPGAPVQAPGVQTYRDALVAGAPQAAANVTATTLHAADSPLGNLPDSGGTVTYFGVEMLSTWTQSGGAQGDSVGVELGFNLTNGTISIQTGDSATGGGLSNAKPGGSINGAPVTSVTTGVGQNIQVAGNGNTVSNIASVSIGNGQSVLLLPTANNCGAQCSISIGPGGVGVAIQTPQGTVLQSLGPSGVLQSAQVSSSLNTIENQLGVSVHMTAPSFSAGSVLPILQTLQGLP